MTRTRLALLVALVLATVGCGGTKDTGTKGSTASSKKVSAEGWMGSICTALDQWEKPVTKVPETSDETNLPAVKTTMAQFLDSLVGATDQLIGRIQDAGTPDIANGESAARDFRAAFTGMQTSFKQAKSTIDAAPTDDKAKFATGLAQVGARLKAAVESAGNAFDEISKRYPELAKAGKEAKACGSTGG